ncbi:cytochrome P450 [Streptomyces aculeolatus]|uniref:cytochrome P450 n=1 Tax=Streptomyces aculeolatus TaxID=270689 RepID=UPI001CEC32DA|nr:cytochrome P450 [Streptomyces aculeolatus]
MSPSTPFDHGSPGSAAAPPAGCPAHDLVRLGGPEAADSRRLHEELRERYGAVAPVLLPGDLPAWLVLGYAENLRVARSPATFTRDSRLWKRAPELTSDHPLAPIVAWQPLCVFTDGEDHKRLRSAVTESLGSVNKRGIRTDITRFADRLVDEFAQAGEADLVGQFAHHLPLLVVTKLFGMPEEFSPRLIEAAWTSLGGGESAATANDYLTDTLDQLVARKKAAPGNDITTRLLAHSSGLNDIEVREHLRLILIAANATTVSLVGHVLLKVLTDKNFRGNLSGGQMTLPSALDQVLWDNPPMERCPHRVTTGKVELGETEIPEGELLVLGLSAANFDPYVRPDLDAPVHGNSAHLAFSAGPHECPGQDFARAITETGIETLLTRLPQMELAVELDELTWRKDWTSSLLEQLPVTFPVPQKSAKPVHRGAHTPADAPVPAPRREPAVAEAAASAPAPGAADAAAGPQRSEPSPATATTTATAVPARRGLRERLHAWLARIRR